MRYNTLLSRRAGACAYAYLALLALLCRIMFSDNSRFILTPAGCALIAATPLYLLGGLRSRKGRLRILGGALWAAAVLAAVRLANSPVRAIFAGALAVIAYLYASWREAGTLTRERRAVLICALSLALRLYYVQITGWQVRQHDVNPVENGDGHIAYVNYILDNGFRFPALDIDPRSVYLFYHPPFSYYVSALWVKLGIWLGDSPHNAIESLQTLSLVYGGIINICVYRIFEHIGLRGRHRLTAYAFCCFSPIFVFMSASVNNDCLMTALFLLTILCALRWYERATPLRIAQTGLALALCTLTKLSGSLAAVPVAALFLFKYIKTRDKRALRVQFLLFLAVCAPLGASYALFTRIKYGMPLNYVAPLATGSPLYIGNYGVLKRLFSFDLARLRALYVTLYGELIDYNIILTMLKQSVFEEFTLFVQSDARIWISRLLFAVNALVAAEVIWAALCLTRARVKEKKFGALDAALSLTGAALTGSFILFCFQYPHTCTMNMRYVAPMAVLCMGALGLNERRLIWRQALCGAYCALSALQFLSM